MGRSRPDATLVYSDAGRRAARYAARSAGLGTRVLLGVTPRPLRRRLGAKSAALGRPLLAGRPDLALVSLPSSSPAHTRPFEEKLGEWMRLQPYLAV